MTHYFNTEGLCDPDIHYMVRLDDRLDKIKSAYVDRGRYFVINRGRQYGKTTTLRALARYLRKDYLVISMDFQMLSTSSFASEGQFVAAFSGYFVSCIKKAEKHCLVKYQPWKSWQRKEGMTWGSCLCGSAVSAAGLPGRLS